MTGAVGTTGQGNSGGHGGSGAMTMVGTYTTFGGGVGAVGGNLQQWYTGATVVTLQVNIDGNLLLLDKSIWWR